MHEEVTGNARTINYRFPPIVRMTNTAIEAGETSREDLFSDKMCIRDRYWEANMHLLEPLPAFNLYNPDWMVFTNRGHYPPTHTCLLYTSRCV